MSGPIRPGLADRLAARKGPKAGEVGVLYVIDRGKFEWQFVLLLASLRRRFGARLGIHAYLPASVADTVDARVLEFHRINGVEPEILDDHAPPFARPYRHGNKILACARPRPEPVSLFVDTDILFLRPANPITALGEAALGAVPARDGPWRPAHEALWRAAYAALGLGAVAPPFPYYNAGAILFRNSPVFGPRGDEGFGAAWLEIARRIDHAEGLTARRPWLDQIALGVLAGCLPPARRTDLPRAWNHSLTGRGQRPDRETVVLHYHGGAQGNRLRSVMGRDALDALLDGAEPFGDFIGLLRALHSSIAAHERPDYKRAPRQAKLRQDWE